jgi:hypothetical protein
VSPKLFLSLRYVRHKLCTYIASRLALSKRTELSLEPLHLGVPSGVWNMISEPIVRLAQTVHLSCIDTNTQSKQKELHDSRHLKVPLGASKTVSEPTQTVHLSYVKISTISERTEMRFHLSLIT